MAETFAADLTTEDNVHKLFLGTPFESTKVAKLSSGDSLYTFRLTLRIPYEGKDTVILKHTASKVKTVKGLQVSAEYQFYEHETLKQFKRWLPQHAFMTVPLVFFVDNENHIFIMEDIAEYTLQGYITEHNLLNTQASKIGEAVGQFVANFHLWARGNDQLLECFKHKRRSDNKIAQMYYQPVFPMLVGLGNTSADILQAIERVMNTLRVALPGGNDIILFDFKLQNMMVTLKDDGEIEHVYIIDFEAACPGIAALDAASFLASAYLLRVSVLDKEITASTIIEGFLKGYGEIAKPDDEFYNIALGLVGAIVMSISENETVGSRGQEVADGIKEQGKEILLHVNRGDTEWVLQSLKGM